MMDEKERMDRVGADRPADGGDRGRVQQTAPDTYRGPYGEPIVVPVTDDPEGHPDYQPGHGDAATADSTDDHLDAFLAPCHAFGYPVPHIGLHDIPDSVVSLADLAAYYRERDSRGGQPDHGSSERRDG